MQVLERADDADIPVDEAQSLIRLRDVCDRMTVTLHDEPLDRATMLRAETKLRLLAGGLERKIREYRAAHAGKTEESRIVTEGLETLKEDLAWLRVEHDSASRAAVASKLRHALRSTVNALTLLRWAWL